MVFSHFLDLVDLLTFGYFDQGIRIAEIMSHRLFKFVVFNLIHRKKVWHMTPKFSPNQTIRPQHLRYQNEEELGDYRFWRNSELYFQNPVSPKKPQIFGILNMDFYKFQNLNINWKTEGGVPDFGSI